MEKKKPRNTQKNPAKRMDLDGDEILQGLGHLAAIDVKVAWGGSKKK